MRSLLSLASLLLGCVNLTAGTVIYVSLAGEKKVAVYRMDSDDGKLTHANDIKLEGKPGALTTDPKRRFLFASLRAEGRLASFRIDPTSGRLTPVSVVPAGADPAHLSTDRTGTFLFTAYYVAAKVTVHRIGSDGTLPEKPLQTVKTDDKAHAIVPDPSNRFVFVPHTGPNVIFQFAFHAEKGRLNAGTVPRLRTGEKTGPRHLVFHPTRSIAYVINEQGSSVTTYALDGEAGTLKPLQTVSTLPKDFRETNATAEIKLHPTGRFLYASNRGHDSIAMFAVDSKSGMLTSLGQEATERTPRSFDIDPSGKFLYAAGESSGKLACYRIDEKTGKLKRFTTLEVGKTPWWIQAVAVAEKQGNDWPRWRGPNADGVADGRDLPLRWSKSENVRWSVKLPGWGTSSPVVYRDRVFVTTHVADVGRKSLLTLCFDRNQGKELWRHDFGFGVDQHTHVKSNLAVNTPAVTADAVYVAFGNADIARYSHDGKLAWVRRYLADFGDPKMAWGYAVSPLVLDDSVLFPWNHHNGPCFLIGLDRKTGEVLWKKDRPIGTAHATPLLVEHHGQQDILVPGQNRLTAFDAKTHAELWRYGEGKGPYNGEIISSPVVGDGVVFLQLWRESKIHAIRLMAGGKPPEPLWVSKKPGPVESSLLYYRGLVYALMDDGILVCLDAKTGDEVYRKRLGAACNSSPIAGNGNIYASDNDGKTFVVRAGREFKLLATNSLGERITASPAVTGNWLIYRTDSHLYCIGEESE
jgi:6-phosphogluconolactonase